MRLAGDDLALSRISGGSRRRTSSTEAIELYTVAGASKGDGASRCRTLPSRESKTPKRGDLHGVARWPPRFADA